MILFWALAAGLAGLALFFLLSPLVRETRSTPHDWAAANIAVHRARVAELETGVSRTADDIEAEQAIRDDATRALLHALETGERPSLSPAPRLRAHRATAVALGLTIPAAAVSLYLWLGEPDLAGLAGAPPVESSLRKQAAATRLVDTARSLAEAAGNRLAGPPARLIEEALDLDPGHRPAHWLAVVAALHEGRAELARDRLERLRALGPMDEEEERWFARIDRQVRERLATP